MRCRRHTSDFSSGVGVCASCLRERLLYLVAAQSLASDQARASTDRKPDPPPLIFPRSVSPYVSRRKSDASSAGPWSHQQRFFSTPQVGPTHSSVSTATDFAAPRTFNKKKGKLSLFSKLFRTRSDKLEINSRVAPRDDCEDSSSSPSSTWFSSIFTTRRKKQQSRTFYAAEETNYDDRRACGVVDRGMSPVRREDTADECEDRSSYCSTAGPSPLWRKTPLPGRRCKAGHGLGKSVSGMSFCLSPLVRASPNRQWNQKGGLPPDTSFSGEIRSPARPHLSTATSFCKNRSRKLADFGRVNPNR